MSDTPGSDGDKPTGPVSEPFVWGLRPNEELDPLHHNTGEAPRLGADAITRPGEPTGPGEPPVPTEPFGPGEPPAPSEPFGPGEPSVPTQPPAAWSISDVTAWHSPRIEDTPTAAINPVDLPTGAVPTTIISAQNPGQPEAASEEATSSWTAVHELFGPGAVIVDPEASDPFAAVAAGQASGAPYRIVDSTAGPVRGWRAALHLPTDSTGKTLFAVVSALLVLVVIVLGFVIGRAAGSGASAAPLVTASATPSHTPKPSQPPKPTHTPKPTPTATVPPTGTLPPGTYQWSLLRGGECLDPFTGAWAPTYTVVNCSMPHSAQLVYAAPESSSQGSAYPGAAALAAQINAQCTVAGIINLTQAGDYSDVEVVGSYPATATQWTLGQRDYYCFVERASGAPLVGSLAGTGPTQ